MAEITLKAIRHSYQANPIAPSDFAIRSVDITWRDGGAYALLGPSGCGKTTLLNIISGLLRPTEGAVLFNGVDVTAQDPVARDIAQIFQFPVIYDTMSVYRNLAFPLVNRGVSGEEVDRRVKEVAGMLDLSEMLNQRAVGLTADNKQKISLGRGLVRSDVNVIMFDEPLTVIDPHLKWKLRSELKRLHQRVGFTMIYVTHDQTEALTFADEVVVMHEGDVVQVGTPRDLFDRPEHTFVGHFIGSPGMNLMPCQIVDGKPIVGHSEIPVDRFFADHDKGNGLEFGIRPECIHLDPAGFPVSVMRIDDVGRYRIIRAEFEGQPLQILVKEEELIPSENLRIRFDRSSIQIYKDGWIVDRGVAK
ncbi:MAG: ABC transporter ATP-binding protein [Proteobacteria bacterium]|jgi:glycerol transport system ATP-binding protein|nr:ABC transporter ATP-binding protein [Gammaproteobacteria bacterium]MCP4827680.1 ABC transporter ATP-binding protein [Pseudomonadota bacterium]HJP06025.1 ABC transporter ATP-binding protein [Arenicellales bacterium]|tara:strand:+ start:3186 stop:4268 length:1083 start_codon:yes stop_codon:yes gene_type:complete